MLRRRGQLVELLRETDLGGDQNLCEPEFGNEELGTKEPMTTSKEGFTLHRSSFSSVGALFFQVGGFCELCGADG